MLEILVSMIKEEWRIHSKMFGGFMFAMFPVMLAVIAFAFSMVLPALQMLMPIGQMLTTVQYTFIMFGLSVGSFGLFGREVMNRRFGHASLLAYSSRTLPVSERRILTNFFVKDIMYYFGLWILPFALGFAMASPFLSISPIYAASFLLILTLSFMIGLSVSFFLSTLYAHSMNLLLGALLACSVSALFLIGSFKSIFLSFSYIPTANQTIVSLVIIATLSILSLAYPKVDYPQKKRVFKNSLIGLGGLLGFSKYSTFMSKDLLDFNRSEGGIGKVILSFLIPLGLAWLLIFVFLKVVPILNLLIIFSIFLGIMSSSFYNWFTEYDTFNFYAFLPVKVSTIIKSKVNSYVLINIVSLAVLVIVAIATGQTAYFLPSLVSFIAISSYTASITIYLNGLNPNILLYNAKIFLEYILMIAPVLLAMIFASMFNPIYLLGSVLLIPLSCIIIKKSCKKWDMIEQTSF